MKVVVLASLAYSLVNFRGALLAAMVSEGHEVIACAPDDDPEVAAALAAMGVRYCRIVMDRTGTNPWHDLRTILHLVRLIRRERPDVVLAYTQKPIVYGGLVTRLVGRGARFHAMVSGLGHVYGKGGGARRVLVCALLSRLYRVAIARATCIFVFNGDDAGEMRRRGILRGDQPVVQVPGSGVDVDRFAARPLPAGPPIFLLVARLLRDKGLAEFAEAARLVRQRYPQVRFQILGPMDPNPSGIDRAELEAWVGAGHVEYLGETRDVRPHLAAATVFVLPSYYREGLPRTILEAMATGRPIITTDMPGCRETVTDDNGVLVPPRDARALAEAMMRFLDEPELARDMGARSRALALARFDVRDVNATLIARMGLRHGEAPETRRMARRGLGDIPVLERPLVLLMAFISLPVMAMVALMILLALGRPILFVQHRAGRDGRRFDLVKFRTMHDVRDASGQLLPDEERLPLMGRLLRRTRLDELPEFWNILRGDMSLIGPRPLLPETVAAMGEAGRRRGKVQPGLTGWAQVNGNVLLTDRDKLLLDLWYIANRSLAADLMIGLRTLSVLVRGERINPLQIEKAYAGAADWRG